MKILEWIEDEAGALVVAAIAGLFGAIGALFLAMLIGARLVRGEIGAWFGIMPGIPVALIVGATVFVLVFLRMRSP